MKVFVGLSGGVDSATAAALLLREGHQVHGLFARIWQPEFTHCTMEADRLSAKRVAAHLSIPFHEVDLSAVYKDTVVQTLIDGYRHGQTPNPDVLCNEVIKFGVLASHAYAQGADFFATGHYAQVRRVNDTAQLFRGADTNKDQSYFLSRLSTAQLARALFPLGTYDKQTVRKMAEAWGLPNAYRPDSQGLCFVGDVSMADFLGRYISAQPGRVLNMQGGVVGEHDGALFYTPGQRHGFRIQTAQVNETQHYVVRVDVQKNELIVSASPDDAKRTTLPLRDVLWRTQMASGSVTFQVRHRQAPQRGVLHAHESLLIAEEPQTAAAGQVVAFYEGDCCIGAGILQ